MPSGDGERDVISIHALRKESDRPVAGSVPMSLRFQSTLSVRRATQLLRRIIRCETISIHALRKESDRCRESDRVRVAGEFQSTLSVRRATGQSSRNGCGNQNFNPRSP